MRSRLFFAALFFTGYLLTSQAAMASGVVLDATCNKLGTTAMADDHTAILLCAFPTANAATDCGNPSACKWKPISGVDNSPSGTWCGYYKMKISDGITESVSFPCKGVAIQIHLPPHDQCPAEYTITVLTNVSDSGYQPDEAYHSSSIYECTCVKN